MAAKDTPVAKTAHPDKTAPVKRFGGRQAITRKQVNTLLLDIGAALTGTLLVVLLQYFLVANLRTWDKYILFFPVIAALARFMGFSTGLIMSVVSTVIIGYYFIPLNTLLESPIPVAQLSIFALTGSLISYLIDTGYRRNDVKEYVLREEAYQKAILRLQHEHAQAREEVKARDEFLSIASHELRTPLTSMVLQLQSVLHSIRNVSLANFSVEHLLKMLDSAEQQSIRLSKMINDLLNVSLITTGRMELEKEQMDLNETVKNVIDRFSEKAKRDGIIIRLHTDKDIIGTWDKLRIEQAISNLLANALKYGNKKPVDITVKEHGTHAEIIVRDNGIGIPKQSQEKIFARFERAVGKNSYEGLGVGLYITRQIVTAHGGKITVESIEGKGSEFSLHLPKKA